MFLVTVPRGIGLEGRLVQQWIHDGDHALRVALVLLRPRREEGVKLTFRIVAVRAGKMPLAVNGDAICALMLAPQILFHLATVWASL